MIKVLVRYLSDLEVLQVLQVFPYASIVRSQAQHTDRSIVNVPLARLKTNTELMQLNLDCISNFQPVLANSDTSVDNDMILTSAEDL